MTQFFSLSLLFAAIASSYALASNFVPKEWKQKIDSYNAFYAEDDSGELDVETGYPKGLYLPLIGNGYVSHAKGVRSNIMYISGLFNNETTSPSHRADIPATFAVSVPSAVPIGVLLDIENGIYHRRGFVNAHSQSWYELRWYAHRTLRHLYVMELEVHVVGEVEVVVSLANNVSLTSKDIAFDKPVTINPDTQAFLLCGETTIPETSDSTTHQLCLVSDNVPSKMVVKAAQSGQVQTFVTAYMTSLDPLPTTTHTDLAGLALHVYEEGKAMAAAQVLRVRHTQGWAELWRANIEISGRPDVAIAINASFYAILSSVRADWAYGLAPGGLTNYYNGHSFWDTETWMFIPLLFLQPPIAQSLLQYRYDRISGAIAKAKSYSPPWQGFMFPWESAYSGVETCPTFAATGLREDHISGDIALAIWQTHLLHRDEVWLANVGYPMLRGIADFWVSRATYQADGLAHILDIIPPDEYVDHVNDSVYSNAVAKLSLSFAVQAAALLNDTSCFTTAATTDATTTAAVCTTYATLSNDLIILQDDVLSIHPEYADYPGTTVKQADVVLLHYPLNLPMSLTLQQNDLIYYSSRTDPHGPAMTWGMHAIGYLDLQDYHNAAKYFNMSFQDNMHSPLQVWTETPDGNAVNFITGAGGFLQTMLNGYGGFRINTTSQVLEFTPNCPEDSDFVKFRHLSYLSEVYDVEYHCVQQGTIVTTLTLTMHTSSSSKVSTSRWLQVLHPVQGIVYEEVLQTSATATVTLSVQELRMKYGQQVKFVLRGQ